MDKNFNGRKTSLVYLERDGKYLILHRTKKEHDENGDEVSRIGCGSPQAVWHPTVRFDIIRGTGFR